MTQHGARKRNIQGNYDSRHWTGLGPFGERVKFFHHNRKLTNDQTRYSPSNFPDVNWSSKRASTAAVLWRLMYFALLLPPILEMSFLVLSAFGRI